MTENRPFMDDAPSKTSIYVRDFPLSSSDSRKNALELQKSLWQTSHALHDFLEHQSCSKGSHWEQLKTAWETVSKGAPRMMPRVRKLDLANPQTWVLLNRWWFCPPNPFVAWLRPHVCWMIGYGSKIWHSHLYLVKAAVFLSQSQECVLLNSGISLIQNVIC